MEDFIELLNGQTDSEDFRENNYTTDNSNVPDKAKVSMLDLKTAMRQMKNIIRIITDHQLMIN
jgi:hypothetical protein